MSAQQTTVRFFYLATFAMPDADGGLVMETLSGTVDRTPAGAHDLPTRSDLLRWFRDNKARPAGLDQAHLVFWQCEPDVYPAA